MPCRSFLCFRLLQLHVSSCNLCNEPSNYYDDSSCISSKARTPTRNSWSFCPIIIQFSWDLGSSVKYRRCWMRPHPGTTEAHENCEPSLSRKSQFRFVEIANPGGWMAGQWIVLSNSITIQHVHFLPARAYRPKHLTGCVPYKPEKGMNNSNPSVMVIDLSYITTPWKP